MYQFINLIAQAVENFRREANDIGWGNLTRTMDAGNLAIEVEFVPEHESYVGWNEAAIYARFIDDARPYCWDGCDNILRFHRGTFCRYNPAHADLDCGCGYDPYEDEINDALAGHP